MKVYSSDGSVLMEIKTLDREGDKLTFTGTVMGAMPVKGFLSPEDLRSGSSLLKGKKGLLWFLATFIFRKSQKSEAG